MIIRKPGIPVRILNMAEALVTFLHLARMGELPEDSYDWMKKSD